MTYKPVHAWKRKDRLPSKDPQKIIYGSELQDEFDAISGNLQGLDDQIQGLEDKIDGKENCPSGLYGRARYMLDIYAYGPEGQPSYDDSQIKADLASETQARIAGDADLQNQIDNLSSDEHGHEELISGDAYIKCIDSPSLYAESKYMLDVYGELKVWEVSPSMDVAGDLTVSGEAALDGGLEVTGDINASGSISVDGDLAITGKIEGDLTINGNITIDGGQIVDPDGNPAGGSLTHVGDTAPADPIEGQMWLNTDDGYLYVYFSNSGSPTWMSVERSS